MKCPNCAREASDDALTCDFCQFVLRREPPPPPPAADPAAAGEPRKLDSPEAVQALMKAALAALKSGLVPEVKRLTTRLFLETSLSDCKTFILMGGDTWLQSVRLHPYQELAAKGLIAQAAALVAEEKYAQALVPLNEAQKLAADAPGQNLLFPMLILGVKGASEAPRKRAAAPAAEPQTLDSAAAIEALLQAALAAGRADRFDEVKRLAARLFIEVDLAFCAEKVRSAGTRWIEAAGLSPIQAIAASRMVTEGADLIGREKFAEALPWLEKVADHGKDAPHKDPVFPMLIVGIHGAVEDRQRVSRYKTLVDQGVKALAAPGGKAEAAACFEQALTLLPAAPRTDAERALRGRLEAMIKAARA